MLKSWVNLAHQIEAHFFQMVTTLRQNNSQAVKSSIVAAPRSEVHHQDHNHLFL